MSMSEEVVAALRADSREVAASCRGGGDGAKRIRGRVGEVSGGKVDG